MVPQKKKKLELPSFVGSRTRLWRMWSNLKFCIVASPLGFLCSWFSKDDAAVEKVTLRHVPNWQGQHRGRHSHRKGHPLVSLFMLGQHQGRHSHRKGHPLVSLFMLGQHQGRHSHRKGHSLVMLGQHQGRHSHTEGHPVAWLNMGPSHQGRRSHREHHPWKFGNMETSKAMQLYPQVYQNQLLKPGTPSRKSTPIRIPLPRCLVNSSLSGGLSSTSLSLR